MNKVTVTVSLPKHKDISGILLARLTNVLHDEMIETANEARALLHPGPLQNSIVAPEPELSADSVTVSVQAGGPTAPYALWVHEGAGPHWAPIEPLKRWAARVLGDARLAYAVRAGIAKRGTRAQKYLERPWLARKSDLKARVLAALQ